MEGDAVRMVTAAEHERGCCCITMTLRDYGRLAQFVLDGGKAGDRQILPPGCRQEATASRAPPPASWAGQATARTGGFLALTPTKLSVSSVSRSPWFPKNV